MLRKKKREKMEKEIFETDNLAAENIKGQEGTEKKTDLPVEESVSEPSTEVTSEVEKTTEQSVNCEELVNEWKDKYLRLSAEFDNYRKRTLKEKVDITKYAGEDILKSILPVVDDFDRAIKNLDQAKDLNAVKEGILLIYGKFKDFLAQKGVKEIETSNSEFNTDFHDAVTNFPVQDKSMAGKIVDVIQKGYMLNDKVVRHAKVVVGE